MYQIRPVASMKRGDGFGRVARSSVGNTHVRAIARYTFIHMHVSEAELKEFINDSGLVAKKDVDAAVDEAKAKGVSIGTILVNNGTLTDDALRRIQAYVLGIPFVNL